MAEEEMGEEGCGESKFSGWTEGASSSSGKPDISLRKDMTIAKGCLQKYGDRNETVWHHLQEIILYIQRKKPEDGMRYFEEMSRDIRMRKNVPDEDYFEEKRVIPENLDECVQTMKFYRKVECLYENDDPNEDQVFFELDFLYNHRLLKEAGVGIPRTELYNIYMAMRVIGKTEPVVRLRFWGKILGFKKDYFIVEADLSEQGWYERKVQYGKLDDDYGHRWRGMEQYRNVAKDEINLKKLAPYSKWKLKTYKVPPLPWAVRTERQLPPREPPSEGVNRYVYYVTTNPIEAWIALPDVTPEQIMKARMFKKIFTGDLTHELDSYPVFPGNEENLLRAQIARISHSTQVSPAGFFTNGAEEEAVVLEEGEMYVENQEYNPFKVSELIHPSMETWVHHEKKILDHGTTFAWRPESDELAGEGMEEGEQEPMELPPDILAPLTDDMNPAEPEVHPWTGRQVSPLMDEDSAAIVRSNLWPGAVTVTKGRMFTNIYVGWGYKGGEASVQPYLPAVTRGRWAQDVQDEYPLGPEIMEMLDPSAEFEELRYKLLNPEAVMPEEMSEEQTSDLGYGL